MSIRTEFPDGVKEYKAYTVVKTIYFPMGDVRCKWCKFCIYDRNRGGYTCVLTDDILYAIDKGVGMWCPLEADEGEKNGSDE